jgi:hypothetical protein
LRRAPKPARIRYKTADDEERILELTGGRTVWHKTEETLKLAGAVSLECLDKNGALLRATRLVDDDDDDDGDDKPASNEKAVAKDRRELAAILDSQGRAIERAYAAGASASAASLASLVETVQTLTDHYAATLTSLHNLSINYANALQANGAPSSDDAPNPMLMQIAGMLAPMLMGAQPAAPEKSNGAHPAPKK